MVQLRSTKYLKELKNIFETTLKVSVVIRLFTKAKIKKKPVFAKLPHSNAGHPNFT